MWERTENPARGSVGCHTPPQHLAPNIVSRFYCGPMEAATNPLQNREPENMVRYSTRHWHFALSSRSATAPPIEIYHVGWCIRGDSPLASGAFASESERAGVIASLGLARRSRAPSRSGRDGRSENRHGEGRRAPRAKGLKLQTPMSIDFVIGQRRPYGCTHASSCPAMPRFAPQLGC